MRFEWPVVLLALVALPVMGIAYALQIRRRRRRAVSYSSVALIRAAAPARSAWRRHIPIALLLTALAALGFAAARPQIRTDVPVNESALILALDVSGSMCANDVDPNRLTAAQSAVRDFVREQNSSTRVGLVIFSGFAQVSVAPTTNRDQLLRAIDSLTTGRGTAIGAAILKSTDAIAQINSDVEPVDPGGGLSRGRGPNDAQPDSGAAPAPAASFAPEIVVLLTDGANTTGIEPIEAARIAASRGVRVYPIGFGTTNPTSLVCTAEQLGGRAFENFGRGFGGPGGRRPGPELRNFLIVDEPTLKEVATITGGTYFPASDAKALQDVLENLPRQVDIQQRDIELSAAFAGLGALLVLCAVWAAAHWTAFPT